MASAARRYHEATKHSFDSVRKGGHFLDWSNKPSPFKVYEGPSPITLPGDVPSLEVPALDALAGPEASRSNGPERLDAATLSRLLLLSAGVTRTLDLGGGERIHFRTYASAGALYPVEVYAALGGIPGVDPGLYHFDPFHAGLTRLRVGDPRPALVGAVGAEPSVAAATLLLILTGMPWRTAWKYGERGYRHLFWDAGMILANLLATASASRLPARVVLGFDDGEVEALLGIDGHREFPMCLVAVGRSDPAGPATDLRTLSPIPDRPLSRREHRFELIQEANDAGRLDRSDVSAWRAGGSALAGATRSPRHEPGAGPRDGLETVIRRRGSARMFGPGPIPVDVLDRILDLATRPIPTDCAPGGAGLIEPYLIANAVEGLQPGAHVYREHGFELLKTGDFRREGGYLCLEQRLAADATVTIFLMANLDRVLAALGDRGYRAAQLAGGIVGGRIYLAAYAHRFGATGLTFYDDEVTEFFSPDAAGKSCMLVVAVGESPRLARGRRAR